MLGNYRSIRKRLKMNQGERDLLVDILRTLRNTEHNSSCSSRFVRNKNTPNSEKLEYGECDCMRDNTITRVEEIINNLPGIAPKQLEGDLWVALRKEPHRMKRVNKDYKLLPTEVFVEFGPDIINIQNYEFATVTVEGKSSRPDQK